jgi:pimeloyl-ACP methyl ester carboxylesterase
MPYTENDGTKIYWSEQGEGEPLLLIMGLGYTSDMWFRFAPRLSERFRVIMFDNRGVGRSDAPAGPYPVPAMAGDALAVLDAAGGASAHIFGISMGGMIAQEIAITRPERVRSLILGCTACGGKEAVPATENVLGVLAARANMTPEEGVWAMVPYIYDASTPRERIKEDLAIRMRTFPKAESYLAQLMGVMAWSSFDRLGSIKAPTLVIQGESDELIPPANARVLAGAIPGAKLVILEQASHIFPTDQPEQSLEEILGFLDSVKK